MSAHQQLQELAQASFANVDPGNGKKLSVDRWFCNFPLKSGASAETRILPQPTKAGVVCAVNMVKDGGGDITLTVTGGYNQAGTTTVVFNDAGDSVVFMSFRVGTSFFWRVLTFEGIGIVLAAQTVTSLVATTATVTNLKFAVTTINAAGSAIGNAAALQPGLNKVLAADNTKAGILPVASDGLVVLVKSFETGKTLPVFPQVNSSIDNLAANAAKTLAAATNGPGALFVADNATHWNCFPGDIT